jgi:hypothetical protein
MSGKPWAATRKLYTIVEVTLICAAAGLLLMFVEPWAAARKAIYYC